MATLIENIKNKIDIVEEIGLVVPLQKSGKSFKGNCPFHNERTPSFYVFPETQTWRCFGCNEGGDLFTFVEKQQGLDFREALRYLAEKAGLQLEDYGSHFSPEDRELRAVKERLYKLNEDAVLWFHQMLLRAREAEEARAYVKSRGISPESVLEFALGFAPDRWEGLSRYLLDRGYTEDEIVQAGLARRRESDEERGNEQQGGIYDYFRNRLIFPIRDTRGRVIGFGGRDLGDGKPKYLNSPQTPLFEKNSVLYALDVAREAIKQAKQVIIVEGYVDAIIAHQYGTKQTVACCGSAITEKHILQLKKLTKQVTLALDPDAAGNKATERGIEEALRGFDRTHVPVPVVQGSNGQRGASRSQTRGIIRLEEQVDAEINVLQLPTDEDPDELIRRDYSSWLYAINHPLPLIDWYFVSKTAGLDLHSPTGQTEAARRLLPVIGLLSDRIKRDAYIRKLAGMIGTNERTLHMELQKILREQKGGSVTVPLPVPLERKSAGKRKSQQAVSSLGDTSITGVSGGRSANTEQRSSQTGTTTVLDRNMADRLKLEDYLIGLLLQDPGLSAYVCGIITDGDFAGTDTRELYHILNSVYQQRASSPSFEPLEQVVPTALQETLTRVRQRVESVSFKNGDGLVKEVVQCATRLKRNRLLQLNTELKFLMNEAAAAGDMASLRQLQQQLLAIHRQLRTINSATHLQG
uniref:DNA primase n=1 Tax=Thermosporothrix sp. COM3 TaxID=2490863 RepID=A0A455SQ55_9CHLR|nr:hypothetical protein KTC_45810 [Thermosporothrix sp. COM3]